MVKVTQLVLVAGNIITLAEHVMVPEFVNHAYINENPN